MNSDANEVFKMRRDDMKQQTASVNKEKEKITRFVKRDKAFFHNKKGERQIKYDFNDPIINREIRENITHHNQVTFRMRTDPIYAKKV